jgi:hypothetical protein
LKATEPMPSGRTNSPSQTDRQGVVLVSAHLLAGITTIFRLLEDAANRGVTVDPRLLENGTAILEAIEKADHFGTPPHDLKAERAVLGSILIDPAVLEGVLQRIGSKDFYSEACATLFARMNEMVAAKLPAGDMLVLTNQLREHGEFDEIGGAAFLAEVAHTTPVAAHANYYADFVADKSFRRRLIHALEIYMSRAYNDGIDVPSLRKMGKSLLERVTA